MKELLNIPQTFLTSRGVLGWGYSDESIPQSYDHYEKWIHQGFSGSLSYLSDYRMDLRKDLKKVYPDFESALVFLFSYQETKKWMLENHHHQIAAYSLGFEGEDYHYALSRRLNEIYLKLKEERSDLESFIALDTMPILERDLARRAGLGWFGKNSMLINQKEGSYFIIGSLLLNQKLKIPSAQIVPDHCGNCNACVEACPTQAIVGDTRTLIADKCISTFTIEVFKSAEPPPGFEKSRGEIFGCDICQDVCPWNYKPMARSIGKLQLASQFSFIKEWFFDWPTEKLKKIIELETNRSFKKIFLGTAFSRPGKNGWLKNFTKKNYIHPK